MNMKQLKRHAAWPPADLALPDSIAEIERGRPQSPAPALDMCREARLARLLALPGKQKPQDCACCVAGGMVDTNHVGGMRPLQRQPGAL
jgi:hypothetical protein